MDVSIGLTDFADDIVGPIEPVLRAVGLLDDDGTLNINDWDFRKATAFLESFERTERILNMMAGFLEYPSTNHRRLVMDGDDGEFKASGLLTDSSDGDNTLEEEWFKVLDIAKWADGSLSLNLIFDHENGSTMVDGTASDHALSAGVGLQFTQTIQGNIITGLFSIPLIRLGWGSSSGPESTLFEPLIWSQENGSILEEECKEDSRSRISLSVSISPEVAGTYYEPPGSFDYPRFSSASIGAAFGNGGGTFTLTLEGFQSQADGLPEDLIIDSWQDVGGAVSSILEGVLQSSLEKLTGSAKIAQNLLPMLGLSKSSHPTLGQNWPTFSVVEMITDAINPEPGVDGGDVLKNHFKDWFDDMIHLVDGDGVSAVSVWIEHLINLIDTTWGGPAGDTMDWDLISPPVSGEGTLVDPWAIDLAAVFPITGPPNFVWELKCAYWRDSSNAPNLDLGCKVGINHVVGPMNIEGSLDTWLVSLNLPNAGGISLTPVPEINVGITLEQAGTDLIPLETTNINGTDVSIKVGSLHGGIRIDRSRDFVPVLELYDVKFGTSEWVILDLTSADTPAEMLNAVTDSLTNVIQAILSDGGALQWFASLLGICSPRGLESGTFAQEWDETQGLCVDILKFISNPVEAIGEYYQKLTTTSFSIPGTTVTRPALSFVFEAATNLLNLGFSELLGNTPAATIVETSDLSLEVEGDRYIANILELDPGVRFELTCEIGTTGDGSIGLGLNIVLMEIPFNFDLELSATIRSELLEISFDSTSSGYDVDVSLLQLVGLELKVASQDDRIDLVRIGSLTLGFEDVSGMIGWQRGAGMTWSVSINHPGFQGYYPNISGLEDTLAPGTDEVTLSVHDKIKSFYWDGNILTEKNGSTHILDSTDDIVVYIDHQNEFNLGIEEDTISIDSIGFSNHGFEIDLSGVSLANFGGVISQMLIHQGGRLGMFIAVFFRPHPDAVHINLGAHATKNQFMIPDWYSCPATGNWPAEWRQLHRSDSDRFGLGPLSVPLDWPGIDLANFQLDPLNAVKDHFGQVMSGMSKSGELFAFSGMRWIWALLNGKLPTMNRPDLGWGAVPDADFMGSQTLAVPEIPLRFNGAGSYDDPWRIPLLETGAGNIEFIMWVGPDGPPASQMASFATSPDPPSLSELLDGNTLPLDLHGTSRTEVEALVDTLYDVAQYSPRVRAAVAGRMRPQLKNSMMSLNDFWNDSDCLVTLGVQTNLTEWNASSQWNGASTSTSESISAMARDAPASQGIIDEILTNIAQVKAIHPTTRVLLIHPPWQSPLIWDSLISEAALRASESGASLLVPESLLERLFIGDSDPMDTDSISLSDYYTLHVELQSGSEWEVDATAAANEAITKILSLDPSSKIMVVGHSIGGLVARQLSHPNLVAACGIAVPDNALTPIEGDWQDALHVLGSLGYNAPMIMGVSQ